MTFLRSLAIALGTSLVLLGCLYAGYSVLATQSIDGMRRAATEPQVSAAPLNASVTAAGPAQRIVISSINLDSRVVETGVTRDKNGDLIWETAAHAVGHLAGTPNPGPSGNVVLAGHISSPIRQEGNVFARLDQVPMGAEVSVDTAKGRFRYLVINRRIVEPGDLSPLTQAPTPTITLITCYPDLVYSHRLVLTAVLIEVTEGSSAPPVS